MSNFKNLLRGVLPKPKIQPQLEPQPVQALSTLSFSTSITNTTIKVDWAAYLDRMIEARQPIDPDKLWNVSITNNKQETKRLSSASTTTECTFRDLVPGHKYQIRISIGEDTKTLADLLCKTVVEVQTTAEHLALLKPLPPTDEQLKIWNKHRDRILRYTMKGLPVDTFNVAVLGPPGCGKSALANSLATMFKLSRFDDDQIPTFHEEERPANYVVARYTTGHTTSEVQHVRIENPSPNASLKAIQLFDTWGLESRFAELDSSSRSSWSPELLKLLLDGRLESAHISGVSRVRESAGIRQAMHGVVVIVDAQALETTKGHYFTDLKGLLKELTDRGVTPIVVLTKVDMVDGELLAHPERARQSQIITGLLRDYVIQGVSNLTIFPCKLYSQEESRSIAGNRVIQDARGTD